MNLQPLIKKLKLDYVNTDIIDEHFPYKEQEGELKLFHFDRYISTEDAIKEMDKEGYEPATLHRILEWAKKEWNGKDSVVALGSVWEHWDGARRVACLWSDAGGRDLDLCWFELGWPSRCRVAAVRKSPLETGKLGAGISLESLDARLKTLEEKLDKLKNL